MNKLGDINPNATPDGGRGEGPGEFTLDLPDAQDLPNISDVVRLRSGGCLMTVIDIADPSDDPNNRHLVGVSGVVPDPDTTVAWTTIDGEAGQFVVPRSCLVKVNLAAEEAQNNALLEKSRRRPPPTSIPGPGVPR